MKDLTLKSNLGDVWLGFNFHVWLVFVCCSVRFYGDLAGFDPFDSIRFGDNIVLLFLRDRFFLLDTGQINPSRTSNREGLMLPGGKPEAELFVEAATELGREPGPAQLLPAVYPL